MARPHIQKLPNRQKVENSSTDDDESSRKANPSEAHLLERVSGVATLLSLIGVGLYGLVRFSHAAFYARLGLTPEDVGLNAGVTLGKVASGFALLIAAAIVVFLFGPAMAIQKVPAWVVFLSIPGFVVIFTLFSSSSRIYAFAFAMSLALISALTALPVVQRRVNTRSMREAVRTRKIEIAAVVAFVTIAAFGVAGIIGYRAAGYALRGEEAPCGCFHLIKWNVALPWASGSAAFLGLDAKPANIRWISPTLKDARLSEENLVYLGTSQGLTYLFDVDEQHAVRVPTALIVVETWPRLSTWTN